MSEDINNHSETDFDDKIEKEIVDKGLTAPRVTLAQIDALMSKLEFSFGQVSPTRIICCATLDGFTVADGFGACVDPKNFNEELGKKIALNRCIDNAKNELWKLEGYRLSRSLVEAK